MALAGSFSEFIQRPDSHKIYLADMRILRKSVNGTPETYPLYVSTEPYFPPPGSLRDYFEVLHGMPSYERNVQEVFSGQSFPSFGEMVLVNDAGTLDGIFSKGWTKDQRVTFRLGGPPDELRYADFGTVMTGIMGMQHDITDREIHIPVFDDQKRLSITVPKTVFTSANSGGSVPSASENIPRPLIYGEVLNFKPTLIDLGSRVYGVASHAVTSIGTVYDNGIVVSTSDVDLANARFTLTAEPAGEVTCDVRGRATQAGTYTDRVGGVLEAFLLQEAGYSASDIDQARLKTLKQTRDMRMGIAITQTTTALEVIDRMIAGLLVFYGHNRAGALDFQVMQRPTGPETLTFRDDVELLEGFTWDFSAPRGKVQIAYNNNENVITEEQAAAAVSTMRKNWLSKPYRTVVPTNGTVSAFYPYAVDEELIQTRLILPKDATSIANERLTLLGEERKIVRAPFGVQPLQVNMGDIVAFSRSRYNLSGFWSVIGIKEDYISNSVELVLFQ